MSRAAAFQEQLRGPYILNLSPRSKFLADGELTSGKTTRTSITAMRAYAPTIWSATPSSTTIAAQHPSPMPIGCAVAIIGLKSCRRTIGKTSPIPLTYVGITGTGRSIAPAHPIGMLLPPRMSIDGELDLNRPSASICHPNRWVISTVRVGSWCGISYRSAGK